MSSAPEAPPPRSTYRHGDLRRALLDAGVELARAGGPEAVVLREATRRVGVAPNAAYRHFDNRQALLYAVRSVALAAVARAIEAELAAVPQDLPSAEFARANLRAVGISYLRFAQVEGGLFRTAFGPSDDLKEGAQGAPANTERKGQSGLDPFELLGAALDKLVSAGVLPPERRPGAEFLAWSAVHGLAMLAIAGPLGLILSSQMQQVGERLVEVVAKSVKP
jgi:AcrR family transcriptional regulator